MKVLVVAEDYRLDQYVLKPLVRELMAAVGRPRARVEMCMDPHYTGVAAVLDDPDNLRDVVESNPMADLYLLLIDRDGRDGRELRVQNREAELQDVLADRQTFIGTLALQEVEVWLLAGLDLPQGWEWAAVRDEIHPKEIYFEPLARDRGVHEGPGRGRKVLGEAAARRYARVRQLCPEVAELEQRVRGWLGER
jgi:hypothetical protein